LVQGRHEMLQKLVSDSPVGRLGHATNIGIGIGIGVAFCTTDDADFVPQACGGWRW
jgi:hypothetical protein